MRMEIDKDDRFNIYADNPAEEEILLRFHRKGVNKIVGALFQKVRDGVKLPRKELIMIQITRRDVKVKNSRVKTLFKRRAKK